MPALAEGEKREPRVVAAVVPGLEAARPPSVAERVDGVGGVVERHGGHPEAPDQHLRAAGAVPGPHRLQDVARDVARGPQGHEGQPVEPFQPAQLRHAQPVPDPVLGDREAAPGQEPEGMAEQPPAMGRRVGIGGGIGGEVVFAVMPRPPQRPSLARGRPEQRHHELRDAPRLEGSMREVAVVERGDEEHPRYVERERHERGGRAVSHPEDAEAEQVDRQERAHPQGVEAIAPGLVRPGPRVRRLEQPPDGPRGRIRAAGGPGRTERFGGWHAGCLEVSQHGCKRTAAQVKPGCRGRENRVKLPGPRAGAMSAAALSVHCTEAPKPAGGRLRRG